MVAHHCQPGCEDRDHASNAVVMAQRRILVLTMAVVVMVGMTVMKAEPVMTGTVVTMVAMVVVMVVMVATVVTAMMVLVVV
eukprot:6830623-Alexandrium_andersonii.AAC.1